jgi:hypothetical protein
LADIEYLMAGRADKQPFNLFTIALQHGMKTIPVAAQGTDPELVFKPDCVNVITGYVSLHGFVVGLEEG